LGIGQEGIERLARPHQATLASGRAHGRGVRELRPGAGTAAEHAGEVRTRHIDLLGIDRVAGVALLECALAAFGIASLGRRGIARLDSHGIARFGVRRSGLISSGARTHGDQHQRQHRHRRRCHRARRHRLACGDAAA
jgi:hypothetical protein